MKVSIAKPNPRTNESIFVGLFLVWWFYAFLAGSPKIRRTAENIISLTFLIC